MRILRLPSPSPWIAASLALLAGCSSQPADGPGQESASSLAEPLVIRAGKPVDALPGETHLRNIRQLTFAGENAEAYWSSDGTRLVFQRTLPPELPADQIFVMDLATGEERMVSTGKGRTTCAYFMQGDERIVFASTHFAADEPPPAVRVIEGKYVWPVFETYEIYSVNVDGSDLRRLTEVEGYDAEATVDPNTGRIVFTSMRDDDLELYTMAPDGSDQQRITDRYGYDGGAYYNHAGTRFVQRSGFFADDAERENYTRLLKQGYVMPSSMEITVLDVDGGNFQQVTDNGKANFAPFWLPDDERIIFSSNQDAPRGRDFELYVIDADGQNQERITHNPSFDGFPMFSPDGKYLVFCSNRYGATEGDTNIFVAEWVD